MSLRSDTAVGMMDSAYFVGRRELLEFFNDLLSMNLTKIEQTASGAVACQITDYIFPGSVPMSRVNWEARSDYEFIQNYKLLQVAFTKNRVQRHVDVDRLIRAKYQDNLEFCQWLKAFFEQAGVYRPDYDPIAVRAKGKGGKKWNSNKPPTNPTKAKQQQHQQHHQQQTTKRNGNTTTTRSNKNNVSPTPSPTSASTNASSGEEASVVADAALMKKNAELTTQVSDLELAVIEIEKERDFYFEKLRNVEVLVQVHQEKVADQAAVADGDVDVDANADQLLEKILKVLYATAEDAVGVNDDGEIISTVANTLADTDLGDDLDF